MLNFALIFLTQFLYKGQKLRGTEPVTNQRLLNLQEKEASLTYSTFIITIIIEIQSN